MSAAATTFKKHLIPKGAVWLWVLSGAAALALFITFGIFFSLATETVRFFALVPPLDFFFGTTWSPQIAIRPDQVGSSGAFGLVPLVSGTLLITVIALSVAVPLGLMSGIYLAEYSTPRARFLLKPALELLAGVPSVVYGFFALLTVAPLVKIWGDNMGIDASAQSALAAGAVMGVMIVPFISSLCDDVLRSTPQALRDGALALGATRTEMIFGVLMPRASRRLVGAFLLAFSRAVGETMIVVMAAGLAGNLTANPFHSVTTMTVQITSLLVGDQSFDSAKTLAAFALGAVLFVFTLLVNVTAIVLVKDRQKGRHGL